MDSLGYRQDREYRQVCPDCGGCGETSGYKPCPRCDSAGSIPAPDTRKERGATVKPATALPWYSSKTGNHQGLVIATHNGANVAVTYGGDEDAAYIVHACNLYPRLVEALEKTTGLLRAIQYEWGSMEADLPCPETDEAEQLLTECGEDE